MTGWKSDKGSLPGRQKKKKKTLLGTYIISNTAFENVDGRVKSFWESVNNNLSHSQRRHVSLLLLSPLSASLSGCCDARLNGSRVQIHDNTFEKETSGEILMKNNLFHDIIWSLFNWSPFNLSSSSPAPWSTSSLCSSASSCSSSSFF